MGAMSRSGFNEENGRGTSPSFKMSGINEVVVTYSAARAQQEATSMQRMARRAFPFVALALAACSPEMGRTWNDTDISCLRKQMGDAVHTSFPLAANECQRLTNHNTIFGADHAKIIPLDLKGAPDLQALAEEYGYSYTK
ncbi:hypothetical protein [Acetobacter estunensis]|uniref:hypothetical protein n=1 Tax=Acetobacter estunensis TaxID=104097 RepID=UPI0020C23131|nr:hypothetical protein [Acetobacter estunensis]